MQLVRTYSNCNASCITRLVHLSICFISIKWRPVLFGLQQRQTPKSVLKHARSQPAAMRRLPNNYAQPGSSTNPPMLGGSSLRRALNLLAVGSVIVCLGTAEWMRRMDSERTMASVAGRAIAARCRTAKAATSTGEVLAKLR